MQKQLLDRAQQHIMYRNRSWKSINHIF